MDIFIIPKQYKKEFLNIIEIGLKNSSDTKEVKDFFEQYLNKNSNNNYPGAIKL